MRLDGIIGLVEVMQTARARTMPKRPHLDRVDCIECASMRFEVLMTSYWALSQGKGPRAAFRERGLAWTCIGFHLYEDVRNFLSTSFETLTDQKFPGATRRTNLKILASRGVHTCPKSRILEHG